MSIHLPILRNLLLAPMRTCIIDDRRAGERARSGRLSGGYRGAEILIAALHVASEIERRCASSTVGVMLPTSGAFPIAALAGWMVGKVVVPLNYLLKPEELQYVIGDCGCDTIITARALLDATKHEPRAKSVVHMEDLDFRGVPDARWPAGAAADDLGVLLYTSGTSGKPKGVMLTHGNISSNIRQVLEWVDFTPADVALGVLPQFHSFGLTVMTLLPLAARIPAVYTARFIPAQLVRLLRRYRPTFLVLIPSMYNALLHVKDATREDFASLRFIVSGGEPLPRAVFEGFRTRFGVTINEGYGLTETSPVTNWCRPFEYRERSVGRAIPDVDQRIIDIASGREAATGEEGEVRMAGPNIMRGYYRLPRESAAAFDERGYFRTGDMGRLDADGHLSITGRLKEMLIVGGENVFPREIEEVLNAHAAVKDSGVVGAQDPMRGELPVAFVELKEGQAFDERALLQWCRERLAGYKVPREIRVLDALPRNPTGKVMRRELKAMLTGP